MTYGDVISYFGTQTKLAAALGITQGYVSLWKGEVPARFQFQIEVMTGGVLKADRNLLAPRDRRRSDRRRSA